MKHCTQCGHQLGLGRFCTNCGHAIGASTPDPLTAGKHVLPPAGAPLHEPDEAEEPPWQEATAERIPPTPPPTAPVEAAPVEAAPVEAAPIEAAPVEAAPPVVHRPPRTPPPASEPPPPPRFPLYADEFQPDLSGTHPTTEPGREPAAALASGPDSDVVDHEPSDAEWAEDEWTEEEWDDDWEDAGRSRTRFLIWGTAVLAALVLGAWVLIQVLDSDDTQVDDPATPAPAELVDHTPDATATAPRTAPPNQDVEGNPTSYDASNMLDGVPETTWRAAGDRSGLKLVFTFATPTSISEIGLINGYAKESVDDSGATLDWYLGHRRISEVTWNLGGTVVRQELSEDRELQRLEVEPVKVRKIVLKIVKTTAPGSGPAGRNFTAISDVWLAG
ncbi:hypothetical protein [Nocardioides sp.]|uniref:NADase-type glycan-binding domain-containing protein n=1 Tax=Nocardioides sp. TaxID=35761 RepID=UPI0035695691